MEEITMPMYNFQCGCGYRSEEFVWHIGDVVYCPRCHGQMERLFTRTNMRLLNRSKPCSFQHRPEEMDADKDIWATVITDAQRGTLKKDDYKFWKKEMAKSHPEIIT